MLGGLLRTTCAAVIYASHEFLGRGETLQASLEGGSGRSRQTTHRSLLRLNLNVEAEIEHRVLGASDVPAFVAGHAAAQLSVKRLVKETVAALRVMLGGVVGGFEQFMEFVDDELIEFMSVLLVVSCQQLPPTTER